MCIETLTFDFPDFRPLDERSIDLLNACTPLDQTPINEQSVFHISAAKIAKYMGIPSVKSANIINADNTVPSQAYTWHIDGDFSEISIATNRYPTEFAECTVNVKKPSVKLTNSLVLPEDGEHFKDYTEKDFLNGSAVQSDAIFYLFDSLTMLYGKQWLTKANYGCADISEYVTVKNLNEVQAMPNVLATGSQRNTLHRAPTTPQTQNRNLFRALS